MLKDSCLHYIWENFVAVSQEEEFGDLPKEMICSDDLLGSENLKVDSEIFKKTAQICFFQSLFSREYIHPRLLQSVLHSSAEDKGGSRSATLQYEFSFPYCVTLACVV